MEYKDIKIGQVYKTKSNGEIVRVKIKKKMRTESFYSILYEYIEIPPLSFGCSSGVQYSETKDFPNVSAVD
jgi:hypothetical protein